MFIKKMANNIFVYWSDGLRAAHLTITVGEQGFPNKNCPQGRVFDNFFQVSGVYLGGGGGCSRLELTRTLQNTEIYSTTCTVLSMYCVG